MAEIFLILVVGVIVIGPKRLPTLMRTLGRWIAKARRTIFEVRANTGIDKLIRDEGLENEIREISSLTRSNVLSTFVANNPMALAARSVSGITALPPPPKPTEAPANAKKAVVQELAPSPSADAASTAPAPSAGQGAAGEPALMAGPAPNAAALALIKPASGAVSRRDEDVLRLLMRAATGTTREREYPTIGCDAYDVLPDDIDDPEAYGDEPPEDEGGVDASAPEAGGDATEAPSPSHALDTPKETEIERTA